MLAQAVAICEKAGLVGQLVEASAARAVALGLDDRKAEGREALVRLPSGEVVQARTGDVVAGGVVTEVGVDSLHLWRDGVEEVLTIPA